MTTKSIKLIKESQGAWVTAKLLAQHFDNAYACGASDIVKESNEDCSLQQYASNPDNKGSMIWCCISYYGDSIIVDGWLDKNREETTNMGHKYLLFAEIGIDSNTKAKVDSYGDTCIVSL